jgi:hypothetical protein
MFTSAAGCANVTPLLSIRPASDPYNRRFRRRSATTWSKFRRFLVSVNTEKFTESLLSARPAQVVDAAGESVDPTC